MKNSNLIKLFMIMFLFTCSYAEGSRVEKLSDKSVKNNVVYVKGESTPFTGKLQAGEIEQEYRNGIKDGVFKGKIRIDEIEYLYEGRYVEGIKHGLWIIKYITGEKRAEIQYEYDTPIGQWTYFFKDKKVEGYETFKNGVHFGPLVIYDKEGNILVKVNYKDGFLDGEVVFLYDKDALDVIANFKYGKLDGDIEMYSRNNNLQLEGNYLLDKRESIWKLYYTTGDLKIIVPYKNGLKTGKSIIYDKAGGIIQIAYFKDNNEVTANGELIKKARPFKDGIVERFKKFNANLESLKINKALSEI